MKSTDNPAIEQGTSAAEVDALVGRLPSGATDHTASVAFDSHPHTQKFWSTVLQVGLYVLAGETVATMIYCALTPHGSHRILIFSIALCATLAVAVTVPFVQHIASTVWRSDIAFVWTLAAGLVATLSAHLDGGIDSPLIFMLILPIASAAIALPTRKVAICGVATFAELGYIFLSDQFRHLRTSDTAIFATALLGLTIFAVVASAARTRRQNEESQLRSTLSVLARTDTLTKCLNHGAFYERLDAEVNRALRQDESLSLLMIDVDLFKSFNDAHGHVAGDEVLTRIGTTLREVSRNFDVVGRVGGDEFAVVLPTSGGADAATIAERVRRALVSTAGPPVTASVGFATLSDARPTAKELVRAADSCLYEMKLLGSGRRSVDSQEDPASRRGDESETTTADAELRRVKEHVRETERTSAEALSILDAYQSTTTVGLGFSDTECRMLRINPMLAELHGGYAKDQIGRTIQEIVPDLWPQLEPLYRSVIDTGTPVINQEVSGETAAEPGVLHTWLTNLYPVTIEEEIIGVGTVVVDISDQKRLFESQVRLNRSVVAALAGAVEMRDPYTSGHEHRVAQISGLIAKELHLEESEIESIELAAEIHDVGKLGLPAELLSRPGKLTAEEMALIRTHAQIGSDMLGRVGFPECARQMVLQHHERLDGSGYPQGLQGEHIKIGSRIIAVADVFDAMFSDRPYRPSLTIEKVLGELRSGSGVLYDPSVVLTFLELWETGRITS
jgi:diguanylate cyclase (GGDEF)-like protein